MIGAGQFEFGISREPFGKRPRTIGDYRAEQALSIVPGAVLRSQFSAVEVRLADPVLVGLYVAILRCAQDRGRPCR